MAEVTKLSEASRTAQVELSNDIRDVSKRFDVFAGGVLEYTAQLELDVQDLKKRFDRADRLANKRRDSVVTQVSAILGLYRLFEPSVPYPPFGGWAIGGECAHLLVSLVLDRQPRWIIEAGSGLSTILAAYALEKIGGQGHIVALEHDEGWREQSLSMIADHGLSHRVDVIHAPLVATTVGHEVFPWYDLAEVDLPDEVEMIFVDGPPQATGTLARYPALPLLYPRLAQGGVLLMDDALRADEREIVERWTQEYSDLEVRLHPDSKGSVEITKHG
jgi:predicted O-methyltransferase YrrM